MVATIGKGTVAQYYLRRTEYYLTGQEPAGVWLSTSAALRIAVGQTVEADLFEKLHAGLGPDGKPLSSNGGGKKQRVSGYDLTLSAPKSVSILFALADDETRAAIERVQLEAAQAVIAMLNQEAAFTRRGHNGLVIEKASLIVAAFQHGEARPAAHSDGRVFADMDLHSHLCIANIVESLTQKSENISDNRKRYSAVDGRAIYAHKMMAGSVYHLALSAGLQKLGFEVAITGTNGIFEIINPDGALAVDADTKRYFSSRRSKIEERLAEYDLVTGEAQSLAAAVGKATRLSKSDSDQDRFELWREIATERGIDCATFAQDLRTDRKLTDREREALIGERLAQVPLVLTEQESVFERRTLLAAVASALVGTGVDSDRLNVEVDRIISTKQIVALGHDIYGHGLYSTPDMIAIEKRLQVTARKMGDRKWAALDQNWVKTKCDEMGLSEEQQNAALAATDDSAICVISGAAGSGKTSTMGVVVSGYREGNVKSGSKKILGAAIAWRTAEMLEESLGIKAFSVDSLLAQISAGKPLLDSNTVLLVDECGQIGSHSMDRLLTAAARARSKVIFIGDQEQLQPISAGPALKILTSVVNPAVSRRSCDSARPGPGTPRRPSPRVMLPRDSSFTQIAILSAIALAPSSPSKRL
jgi:conjugative relaxase-like TrwC/TraI family protein